MPGLLVSILGSAGAFSALGTEGMHQNTLECNFSVYDIYGILQINPHNYTPLNSTAKCDISADHAHDMSTL